MNRIVFISPFRDLSITAQEVAKKLGLKIEFYEGWLDQVDKIMESLGSVPPVDVILSRGGVARYLADKYSIPVIRVNVSPYDILEGLEEARRYSENIVITSYAEPVLGLSLMEKVLNISITEVVFTDQGMLEEEIAELSNFGKYCIVGGGPSVAYAKKYGLPSVFLHTNSATLHSAFQNADELATLRKEETRKSQRLNAILDAAYEGIISVDSSGIVDIFNKAATTAFGQSAEDVIGKHVVDVVPKANLHRVLETGNSEIGDIMDIGNLRIIANRVPVKSGEKTIGAVAIFQELNKVVRDEQKIRKELTGRSQFRAKAVFSDIIGESSIITAKKKIAVQFAKSDLTIFLYGASGTGKELFAQSIHNASNRSQNPFVAINCGALPPTLLESELFGYEEGAFTGARRKGKYGLFELAHKGTIFLDEIDALPFELQARLLRVLQEREVLRVGGETIIPIDVRVIAATNTRPEDLVQKQMLREDLFYRLNVLYLEIPPLYKRKGDIRLLCEYFLPPNVSEQTKLAIHNLMPYFERYSWPGNIRELQNIVQRVTFFAKSFDQVVDTEDYLEQLAPNIFKSIEIPNEVGLQEIRPQIKYLENELILKAVDEHRTLEEAAAYLGIGRSTLTRKLKQIRETTSKK